MLTARRSEPIRRTALLAILILWLAGTAPAVNPQSAIPDPQSQESPQARGGARRVEGYYKGQITPHWFADNTCFWYRTHLSGNTKEFILVDAEENTRQPAFDHQKLGGHPAPGPR